jgi:hypothetical protein
MKRVVIIVVALLTLIAIPVTVFLSMRSQELRKRAAPATNIAFSPASVTKAVGEEFTLEARINTADNQVVATQINVTYDPTKLEAVSITNGTLFPNILSSGVVGNGTASIAVGAANTTTPIHGSGTAAVVKFKAIAATSSPISVRFANDTYVGALGEGSSNVLVGTTPATITVTGGSSNNLNVTPTATPSGTLTPTLTPTPTSTDSASNSAVSILTPIKNESVADQTPTFEGKAPAGSTVTIVIHSDEQITATVVADANGNWTYTVAQPISSGPHTITIAAKDPTTSQTNTATIAFVVASGNENGASGSAIPATGAVENTFILLGLGILFMIIGTLTPRLVHKL